MKAVRPEPASDEQVADREIAKAIAYALLQGKTRQQIVEQLVASGLSEESARRFVNRVMPG
jgi:hypothetical protein